MGSCVAPSSSEQPRHNAAPVLSASAQSIKTTKGRTAVPQTQQAHTAPDPAQKGPTVVEQEYLQSAQSPEASMRYDCQGLRLLPGDLMLHSECLAAHRAGSNQGNHGSAQPAKYLDGALVVEASTRLDQPYTVGGSCPKGEPYSGHMCSFGFQPVPGLLRSRAMLQAGKHQTALPPVYHAVHMHCLVVLDAERVL